jgi:D-aspartate ligase
VNELSGSTSKGAGVSEIAVIPNNTTPVVLLRAVRHGGLGIVRSLGRLGVPVYVADPERWSPAVVSHYCRGHFPLDLETAPAEKSIDFLLDLARKVGGPPILIPTTDPAALFVARHADALRGGYLFPNQESETTFRLANKAAMFHLARRFGIPTPETYCPHSRADVLAFLETARMPVMLKALDYRLLVCRTSGSGKQLATSRDEVLAKYDVMQHPEQPNIVLQEYIPGGDDTIWMFNGYFNHESECLFGMTGKKIRQTPVYTGSTSLGVCLRNDEVHNSTVSFMKALGYRGILDIGYRYDARDGKYKLLDSNPRIGSTFRLFIDENGMDVARTLYLDLTGQRVPLSSPRYGRKWMVEDCDLVSSARYYRDGKLRVGEWLRSFRGVEETAFFLARDPAPVVPVICSDLRELARRAFEAGSHAAPAAPAGRTSAAIPTRPDEQCDLSELA